MSGDRLYRAALHAYPKAFRRAFGTELVRSMHDLRRHTGLSRGRVVLRLSTDLLITAPRLRLESAMTRSGTRTRAFAVVALGAVLVLALAIGSPVLVVGIVAVVGLAAVLLRNHDRPIVADDQSTGRWWWWLGAGALSFAVGFVALVIEGDDELSAPVFWTWITTWTLAAALALFSLVLGASHVVGRRHRGGVPS